MALPKPSVSAPSSGHTFNNQQAVITFAATGGRLITSYKISVYRAHEIGDDGTPLARPYFGTVRDASQQPGSNYYGPITTHTVYLDVPTGSVTLSFDGDPPSSGVICSGGWVARIRYSDASGDRSAAAAVRFNVSNVACAGDTIPLPSPLSPLPGANPKVRFQGPSRRAADEFKALDLAWNYISLRSAGQKDIAIRRTIAGATGSVASWNGTHWLHITNGVQSWVRGSASTPNWIAHSDHRIALAGLPYQATASNFAAAWGCSHPDCGTQSFNIQVRDTGNRVSPLSPTLTLTTYQGMRLHAISPPGVRVTDGQLVIEWANFANLAANLVPWRNLIRRFKVAIYDRDELTAAESRGQPDPLPVAGTIREPGQTMSPSGAHWVTSPNELAGNTFRQQNQAVSFDFRRDRIFFAATETDPSDRSSAAVYFGTEGLLPDGDYRARIRAEDLYGNRLGPISYDFTTDWRDCQTIVPVPRAYNEDDELRAGLEGLIPADYIGLQLGFANEPYQAGDWLPESDRPQASYIAVQRREYDRNDGLPLDDKARWITRRIRPSSVGSDHRPVFPASFTDNQGGRVLLRDVRVENRVLYQYRLAAVNRYGNYFSSGWIPA